MVASGGGEGTHRGRAMGSGGGAARRGAALGVGGGGGRGGASSGAAGYGRQPLPERDEYPSGDGNPLGDPAGSCPVPGSRPKASATASAPGLLRTPSLRNRRVWTFSTVFGAIPSTRAVCRIECPMARD